MTTSVKITALTNIGANIAYSTLVPVVNMAGTPTTQKANLQIVGNLILTGAGGSYFPAAAQAVLAQTVTNAAQPNITSVGTLTTLAVTGNITAGNINGGNLVSANFFSGDGGLLSNVASGSILSNGTSNITIVEDGAISFAVAGVDDILEVGSGGLGVTGGLGATGNVNAGQNFRTPNELRLVCNTANGGVTWRFGIGGALYFPTNSGNIQHILENNIDDEFEILSTNNVVISTDIANSNSHFTFDSDGIFRAPSNVVLSGTTLFVGPNAESAGNALTAPTLVISSTSNTYSQAVLINENNSGSSDWIAQGADGTDTEGYSDFGFNGNTFADANFSLSGAGDGYFFVQSYANSTGGNLVLATGTNGTTKDIIFGTNGFTASNIFGRISHANNALELSRANAAVVATIVKTTPVTVSALPSAATAGAGARAFVTDADSVTFNAPAVGGAANNMPVFSNGTGWFIG
jgi:hypothetical protein